MKRIVLIFGVLLLSFGMVDLAGAESFFLSDSSNGTIGTNNLAYEDEDIVTLNLTTNTTTLFLNGDNVFTKEEDIDALHILSNGNILFSTTGKASIGALTFYDEDVVEYNPTTMTATVFFDGSAVFTNDEDVDAFSILSNGNYVFSTQGSASINGFYFNDEDLVEYNPTTMVTSLFLDGSTVFSRNEDIDAVHVLSNGDIVLSTTSKATLGGLTFHKDDMIQYNPTTNIAKILYEDSVDNSGRLGNINALSANSADAAVPESSTIVLFGTGLLGLWAYNRRRQS